ncbi:MAG: glycosyltransferase family 2 protein [Candidatus Zixiibacteriota bacterium]
MEKILIIIPAFNESENIRQVVDEIRASQPSANIAVVNDCSTDNTERVVREIGETLLPLPYNLGIGGAVQTGLMYARDNRFDIAVQVDGDGQHPAGEIEKLLGPIRSGDADVVIGSRFLGTGDFKSTFTRRIGIRIIEIMNRMLTGVAVTDNTSGFRAYNSGAIEFLSTTYPQDYPEPVAVVELYRNGFRINEVAVEMRERQKGTSSIGALGSIYYMIKVLVANLIAVSRKPMAKEGD